MKILIVKTSALGDVLQAFCVLSYLRKNHPNCKIHWVIEEKLKALVESHPWIDKAIAIDKKKKSSFLQVRKEKYDVVFDLQGNTKSAVLTFLAKAKEKIGFGKKTVKELPNLLVTKRKFNPPSSLNIRQQYIHLVSSFFKFPQEALISSPFLKISDKEKTEIDKVLLEISTKEKKLLIAPWSNWENKQLSFSCLVDFLTKIKKSYAPFFLFVWGNEEEKEKAVKLQMKLGGLVLPKLTFSSLQSVMQNVDGMIGSDSSLLHLAGLSKLASFSFFGPTHPDIFKPQENSHYHYFGKCPYNVFFVKQCPHLRSCKTGACLKYINPESLFKKFKNWADLFIKKEVKKEPLLK